MQEIYRFYFISLYGLLWCCVEKGTQLGKYCELLTGERDFWLLYTFWLNVKLEESHCMFLIWCFRFPGITIYQFPSELVFL